MKHYNIIILFVAIFLMANVEALVWTQTLNSNLTRYYRFNESSGTAVIDYAGGLNGTSSSTLPNFVGIIGTAYNYSQVSSAYVSTPYSANDMQLTKAFENITLSAWVYPIGTGESRVWGTYDGSGAGVHVQMIYSTGGNQKFGLTTIDDVGTGGTTQTTPTFPPNNWYNVVWVWDKRLNQSRVYINGTAYINYTTNPYNSLSSGTALEIGRGGFAGTTFAGIIDDVAVWKRVLNDTEITRLYQLGLDGKGFQRGNAIAVTLNYPANNTGSDSNILFSASLESGGAELKNASLFYDGVLVDNVSLSGYTSDAILNYNSSFGVHTWYIRGCDISHTCGNSEVRTLIVSPFSYNVNYSSSTSSFNPETFVLNVTDLDSSFYSITASLVYNGTSTSSSKTTTGGAYIFTSEIPAPFVNALTNVSFYWNVVVTNSSGSFNYNTSTYKQAVSSLAIDDCSSYANVLLNLTMYDEDTQILLSGAGYNATVQLNLQLGNYINNNSVNVSFNKTAPSVLVCLQQALTSSADYKLDAEIKYSAQDRVTEYYNIQNYSTTSLNTPINIKLYDLLTTNSQEFLITFKDGNYIPTPDVLIYITRQYIPEGVYKTVEVPKTDKDGRTIGHFVLNDVSYTITVVKNNVVLGTWQNVRAFCSDVTTGDCRINLNADGSTTLITDFYTAVNVSFYPYYNDSSKTYYIDFTSLDGSTRKFDLNLTLYNNYMNQSVCTNSLSSASGTLTCLIPSEFYNKTIIAKFYVSGQQLAQDIFKASPVGSSPASSIRYFMAFLLILTLPLMALAGGIVVTLIAFIGGIILAGALLLVDGGGFVGGGSAFLWIIVAVLILIWKATQGRGN